MINLALLIALPLWSQSVSSASKTNSYNETIIDDHDISIRELRNGRPSITGSPNYLSLLRVSSGIYFSDGTIQVTSAPVARVPIVFSTSTPSGSGTNTVLGACVAGSTISLTLAGGGLACGYSGSISNTGGVGTVWAILTNGVFPSGFTSTTGFVDHLNTLSANGTNVSSQWQSTGTYSGSMNVCMTVATNSGTWVVPGATNTGFTDIAQFWCREIR